MELEVIIAIEEIRRVKARYFRALDDKNWHDYADLFTDDAQLDVSDDLALFAAAGFPLAITAADITAAAVGGARLAGFVRSTVDQARTVHQGHMPEIDVLSATEAQGVWAMTDIVERADLMLRGYGHYHERYRRIEGRWKIASIRLSRLRIDFYLPDGRGGWTPKIPS